MHKAKALTLGNTVGIAAPSGAARGEDGAKRAIEAIEALGFRTLAHESCFAKYGYLSGSDELRAEGVNSLFRDDRVDAVFCLRGGYGVTRILERIDFDAIQANPKIFLGFSDITALHAVINQRCGLITFHGPMPWPFFIDFDPFARRRLLRALTDPKPLGEIRNPEGLAPLTCLVPGRCEGQLAGGNLSVMAALCGTPWQPDVRGKILLLEDVNEYIYKLDALFTQLRNAGLFRDCAGVALGGFAGCENEDADFGSSLEALVKDIIAPFGKPVLFGFSIGHVPQNITVPLGAMCALNANALSLTVLEGVLES